MAEAEHVRHSCMIIKYIHSNTNNFYMSKDRIAWQRNIKRLQSQQPIVEMKLKLKVLVLLSSCLPIWMPVLVNGGGVKSPILLSMSECLSFLEAVLLLIITAIHCLTTKLY